MIYEVKKYERYKNDIKFLLIGAGLWPGLRKYKSGLDIFLNICAAVSSAITVLGVAGFCLSNLSNIQILVKGLGLMFSFSSTAVKVSMMLLHRQDMQLLNRSVTARFEEDLKDSNFRPHLLTHYSAISKFFYVFNYVVGLNIGMIAITPMLAFRHGKYVRAYPQFIPFTYEPGGIVHWSIYGFEVLNCFYLWSINVGADSLFCFYSLHLIGELRLLSSRFENLSASKNYRKDLKECVDRHILLMDSHRLLQRVFGFMAIWLTLSCAVIICAIIFQATETKNMTIYKGIYLVGYCVLKLVQAYSYALCGNLINVESEMCLNAIYNSQWTESGNLRFMNDVLIVQSQNPMFYTAMGCMIVRLDMFTKILNTSVSYFFLLRTLDEGVAKA